MAITYAPTTNFGLKDSLPTNDSDKVIRGSEFTTEFTAIQTAFSLAAPNASPTFTGTVTIPTADINGGTVDGTTIGGTTPAAATFTSLTATSADINGGTIDGVTIGGSSAGAITGTTITGTSFVSSGDMTFGDNDKAIFGAGPDLQIYSDGTSGIIKDVGAGDIKILADDFYVQNAGGTSTLISVLDNGKVGLGFNGSEKLATTATGIDVTGTVTADGLTVNTNVATGTLATLKGSTGFGFTFSSNAVAPYVQELGVGGGEEIALTSGGKTLIRLEDNNDISFYEDTGTTPKFFWDASAERLGIGTSSPSTKLHLQSDSTTYIQITDVGDGASRIGQNGTALTFGVDGADGSTERMRIDSSGNLLVGTTSSQSGIAKAAVEFDSGSEYGLEIKDAGTGTTGTFAAFYRGSTSVGTITTNGTTTTYNISSDARLKENIADAEDASELIDAIQVRSFDWKVDGSHQKYGMVAQELVTVAPEAVSVPEDPDDMMGVDYSKLVPMLVKEIQSLRARVAQLEGA